MKHFGLLLCFACGTAFAGNLIENASFSDPQKTVWRFADPAQCAGAVVDNEGRAGSRCVKLSDARANGGLTFSDIPVARVTAHLFSIWYRTEGLRDYQVWLRANFRRRDASGSHQQMVKKLPAAPEWREMKLWIHDLDKNCNLAELVVQLRAGATGTIWVDDVFFGETDGAQDVFVSPYPIPKLDGRRPGKALAATGFYRVERVDGVWWLVDPRGRLCWSVGVCTAGGANDRLTKSLTEASGKDFLPAYLNQSYDRLSEWGFNCAGSFSHTREGQWDIRAYNREREGKGLPAIAYFLPLGCAHGGVGEKTGIERRMFLMNAKGGLQTQSSSHKLADPFSPEWRAGLVKSMEQKTRDAAGDPNLVGYFADNELYMDDLHEYLYSPNCLAAFVGFLKDRYHEPGALNAAWSNAGQQFAYAAIAGEELKNNPPRMAGANDRVTRDLREFTARLVETYVDQTIAAIRQFDKNHLIIGNRIASPGEPADYWRKTSHLMPPLGKYDLVAANFYPKPMDNEDRVDYNGREAQQWLKSYHEATGKPVIIGEFGVAARDSGVPSVVRWQTRTVDTQQQRGEAYKKMLYSYYNLPYVVGAHWFQWANGYTEGGKPTPRNCGLIDDRGVPYGDFIQHVREANSRIAEAGRDASFTIDQLPFP